MPFPRNITLKTIKKKTELNFRTSLAKGLFFHLMINLQLYLRSVLCLIPVLTGFRNERVVYLKTMDWSIDNQRGRLMVANTISFIKTQQLLMTKLGDNPQSIENN